MDKKVLLIVQIIRFKSPFPKVIITDGTHCPFNKPKVQNYLNCNIKDACFLENNHQFLHKPTWVLRKISKQHPQKSKKSMQVPESVSLKEIFFQAKNSLLP